jgi:purine nucleoside phosphorylase
LKQLGVDVIIGTTAVGSLSEDFPRGTLVVFGIDLLRIIIFKAKF